MSLLTPPMSSLASLKRSYADIGLDEHLRNQNTPTSMAATSIPTSSQVYSQSPSPANLPLPTDSAAFNTFTGIVQEKCTTLAERSNKRTKLSYADKEAKQIEKQFKEQQKAEEKAKKDEEKAKRDEEKRIKDAEKEERKKVKEEQTKLREAEKQKKLDEKNKKARVCR